MVKVLGQFTRSLSVVLLPQKIWARCVLVVYKLKPQVASNRQCCTPVRLGSVQPADPGPSTCQSLQGVLIPDSVKTGATSWTLHRLGPGRPLNNCRWASLKSMLCMCLGPQASSGGGPARKCSSSRNLTGYKLHSIRFYRRKLC